MLGRGRFASPGRTTDRGTDLKLQRQSWRYGNASLAITLAGEFWGQTTAPGYCTSQGPLCWQAVKAGESSYWPGKLLFAGVVNQVLLFTLAGDFSNCLMLMIEAYTVVLKSDKSLLFRIKKWKFITFLCWKVKNHYFFI